MASPPTPESSRSGAAPRESETRESVRTGAQPGEASIVAAQGEPSPIHRERAIAEIAYLLAEKRGFTAGYELDDWLAAEKEVDGMMSSDREGSSAAPARE